MNSKKIYIVLGNANEISNGSGALAPPKRDEAKATIPYFIGIVVLGAGLSVESGIKTFIDSDESF